MALFGNSHARCEEQLAALRGELAELRKRIVSAEVTVTDTAATVLKQMKRAETAARRALEATEQPNQGPGGMDGAAGTPVAPPLTGVRARIAARRAGRMFLPPGEANGIHS